MTVSPPPDLRDRNRHRSDQFSCSLERQRNRYASRAVAFLVILNGVAALLLLSNFVNLQPLTENASKVADAMVVFGVGVAAALASMFFAYLRRTRMARGAGAGCLHHQSAGWLAMPSPPSSAACFVVALRMVGVAVAPALETSAKPAKVPAKPEPGRARRSRPAGSSGSEGDRGEPGERGSPGEKGEKGDQGEKGERGEAGPPGPAGANSPTATPEMPAPNNP